MTQLSAQLSGLDASFLSSETPETPQHTLKVMVFRRPRADRRSTEEWAFNLMEKAISRIPALRLRPRFRSGLAHPRWEETEVALEEHLRFVRLWPRAKRTAEPILAEHLEGPLARDRALWELVVIEEAGSPRVTLGLKYHHSLADGLGSARWLRILAEEAEAAATKPKRASLFASLLGLLPLLWASLRGMIRSARFAQALPFSGGREAYNRPAGARRELGLVSLPMEALLETKKQIRHEGRKATLNDLLLSLTAGALRRLKEERGEEAQGPLVAALPVALSGTPGAPPHDLGNHLSTLLAPLHLEEADPRARLRRTHASMKEAKAAHEARGEGLLMGWSELCPAPLLRLVWGLIRRLPRPPANLIVSNIRGSAGCPTIEGAVLEEVYLVGPLLPTTGLNVTFWSHGGRLGVCVLSAGEIDPKAIAAELEAELRELTEATKPVERISLVA